MLGPILPLYIDRQALSRETGASPPHPELVIAWSCRTWSRKPSLFLLPSEAGHDLLIASLEDLQKSRFRTDERSIATSLRSSLASNLRVDRQQAIEPRSSWAGRSSRSLIALETVEQPTKTRQSQAVLLATRCLLGSDDVLE